MDRHVSEFSVNQMRAPATERGGTWYLGVMPNDSTASRFVRFSSPDVDRALAAAFAVVVTADGDLAASEQDRFRGILFDYAVDDDTDASAKLIRNLETIMSDANALAERMMDDFEPAYRVATARLKELDQRSVSGDVRLFIIDVARALMVADGVLANREETALDLIASALGISSSVEL